MLTIEMLITKLKNNKCRITPQRKAILEILVAHQDKAMTVDELFISATKKRDDINMTTIYRNLELLDKFALLYKIQADPHTLAYKLICHEHHHHHIICSICGKMAPIDYCPLTPEVKQLIEEKGYNLTDHSLKFYGICDTCSHLHDSNI